MLITVFLVPRTVPRHITYYQYILVGWIDRGIDSKHGGALRAMAVGEGVGCCAALWQGKVVLDSV